MVNPYQSSADSEPSAPDTTTRWWWPILLGVLVTPFAMGLAVLSHGFGHGDGFADEVLFPLHRPLRCLIGSENIAAIAMYFGQFVVYGIVLALAARSRRFLIIASLVVAFHVASFILRFPIADLLISIRG